MNVPDTLALITALSGYKLVIRANRFGCDAELARDAHDMVLDLLDELIADLRKLMSLWFSYLREADPQRREDLAFDLERQFQMIDGYWMVHDVHLAIGGFRKVDEDGRFFNPVSRRFDVLEGELDLVVNIPDELLCGLGAILDRIEDECSAQFQRCMVFYKPGRFVRDLATPDEPRDGDDIPW